MKLDIRLPIGLMFGVIGAILTIFGLVSDSTMYQRSLGINVNLWWGLALVIFGAVMLLLAWRAHQAAGEHETPNKTGGSQTPE